jgi:thiamine pyrophosphokinase
VSDKENTKYFTDTKKCGGEKIAQKGVARLQFFGAQNARTGHFAVTVCYVLFSFYIIP